jgi:hypothetical protein
MGVLLLLLLSMMAEAVAWSSCDGMAGHGKFAICGGRSASSAE